MFRQCQSASTPALDTQACLNPRTLHLCSVPEQLKFVGSVKGFQMLLAINYLIRLSYATFPVICYRKLCRNLIRCTNLTSRLARSTRNISCSKGRLKADYQLT